MLLGLGVLFWILAAISGCKRAEQLACLLQSVLMGDVTHSAPATRCNCPVEYQVAGNLTGSSPACPASPALQGLAWIPNDRPEMKDMLCRWVPAFSKSLMCHLRKGEDIAKELAVGGGALTLCLCFRGRLLLFQREGGESRGGLALAAKAVCLFTGSYRAHLDVRPGFAQRCIIQRAHAWPCRRGCPLLHQHSMPEPCGVFHGCRVWACCPTRWTL
jgi:hypothetical protein